VKIELKNESFKFFFQENALNAWKTRLSVTFTQQIQMEWNKSFYVDKIIIFEKKLIEKN